MVLVELFCALIPLFIKMHKSIMSMPLTIPFLSNWLQNKIGYAPNVADFFLIPISARIVYYFRQQDISLNDAEVALIKKIKIPHVQQLPYNIVLKWHYACNYASWLMGYASLPMFFVRKLLSSPFSVFPSGTSNSFTNLSPYISSMLSYPFSLINPQAFEQIDLFVVEMFPTCLFFIPYYVLNPIPDLVLDLLTTVIYGVPHFIYAVKNIMNRTVDDLPKNYKDKKHMLILHNAIEISLALPLLCDIPSDPWVVGWVGYVFQAAFMALGTWQTRMGIAMVTKTIKWHSPYLQVYQPARRNNRHS